MSKSSRDEQVRSTIAAQAGEWFVANDGGPLNAQQSADLVEWLKASPAHVEEFLGVSVVARDLREAGSDPEFSADALVARAREDDDPPVEAPWWRAIAAVGDVLSPRWQAAAVTIAACGVVGLAAVMLWKLMPVPEMPAAAGGTTALHFETRHGEQQVHRLADNSILHLNTDTAVTIRYSGTERLAVLTSGQAEFEVAHEPQRAFRVFAGPAEVVDLGTTFDVRLEPQATVVTVVEGRVGVGLSPMSASGGGAAGPRHESAFVELGANQQVSVTEQGPGTPVAVDAQSDTSWLHRQIAFDNEPLERVAAEFNRYAPKPIEIATPALRELKISGVFSTDDPAAFIAFLRTLKGVRVEETATQVRVSQP